MQCSDAQPLLPDLHAGELSGSVAAELQQHLDSCADCQRTLQEVQEGWTAVQRLAELDARDVVPAADVSAWIPPPARRSPVWLEVAARVARAAVLVLAGFGVAFLVQQLRAPRTSPVQDAGAVDAAAVAGLEQALDRALRPMFTDLAVWMQQREYQENTERETLTRSFQSLITELSGWTRDQRHKDQQYLVALHATRRDLDQAQRGLAVMGQELARVKYPLDESEIRKETDMRPLILLVAALIALIGPAAAQELNGRGHDRRNVDLPTMLRDLEVMRRILDREALTRPGSAEQTNLLFGVSVPTSSEAYYLPGFGALFLAEVTYPVAPPAGPEASDAEVTLWDQVRAEVDGRPVPGTPSSDYDAEPVEALKLAVLRAIAKHGANMAQVPAHEAITVLIRGRQHRALAMGMGLSPIGSLFSEQTTVFTQDGDASAGLVVDPALGAVEGTVVTTSVSHNTVMTVKLTMQQIRRLADRKVSAEELLEVADVVQY